MICSLRIIAASFLVLAAARVADAQVTSSDPNYTVSLLAHGLILPWGGVIYRPATHDLLVNQENSPLIARVDAITGAVSTFASIPAGLQGDRGTYAFEMAINSKGEVFVTLYTSHGPVLRYDADGNYLGSFPITAYGEGGAAFDVNDNFYISEGTDGDTAGTIYKYPAGNYTNPSVFASGFSSVLGLAFNASGQLFAADYGARSVYQVTPGGTTAASHILWASGLQGVTPIAVDPLTQAIFVGSHNTPDVTRITAPGIFSTFASGFSSASALGFDNAGDLFAADLVVGAIWKFAPLTGTATVSPNHGGNAGAVTVTITGEGLESGAVAKLSGSGADIIGANTTLLTGKMLQTTLDLTTVTPGVRDVVVTNPDGTSLTLSGAFTVEQGGAPQISADIIGLDKIRSGGTGQTYYVAVQNGGTIDGSPGLVSLSVPTSLQVTQLPSTALFVSAITSGTDYALPTPDDEGKEYLLFATSGVHAGTTQYAPVRLTYTGGTSALSHGSSVSARASSSTPPLTLSAGWQQYLTNMALDQFLGFEQVPFIPYPPNGCLSCLNNYNAELMAYSNLATPYHALQAAKVAADRAIADFTADISLATAGAVVLSASGAGVLGTVSVGTLVAGATVCVKNLIQDDTCLQGLRANLSSALSAIQSCTGSVHESASCLQALGLPPTSLLTSPAAKALGQLQTYGGFAIAAIDALTQGTDVIGDERLAYATFQQAVGPYKTARAAYQSCLSPTACKLSPAAQPLTLPGTSSLTLTPVASLDPNDKVGSHGTGSQQFVTGKVPLTYFISFENLATATAPAQVVSISDQLDTKSLDISTLALGPITFANQVFTPPPAQANFSTVVDLRPTVDLLVEITAKLNTDTGLLTWTYASLDPATNQPPTDPSAGFLAPGASGTTLFTIRPIHGRPTDTQIRNQATVVFDANSSITTPSWLNTLDTTAPVSHVVALPSIEPAADFLVSWEGTDVGAGVQNYTIYVSDNGGPFTLWLTNTTDTQATYSGQSGHTYRFYSVATDVVGNSESSKTAAESSTLVSLIQTITTVASSSPNSNLNAPVTLSATVVAASGTPIGSVSFLDGATTIGTVGLSASGLGTAIGALTASNLTAGSHSLVAIYGGATGYAGSSSAPITQTVVAPSLLSSLSPTSVTVARGSSGTSTLTLTPVGGYNGTVSVNCGSLPAHISCNSAPTNVIFSGNNAGQSVTLTIGTSASAAVLIPEKPGSSAPHLTLALICLPWLAIARLRSYRECCRRKTFHMLLIALFGSIYTVVIFSGCSGPDNRAAAGTYMIPINVNGTAQSSTLTLTVVVH